MNLQPVYLCSCLDKDVKISLFWEIEITKIICLLKLFYLSCLFHILVCPNISCAIFGYILGYKSAILPALIDGSVSLTPVQH